MTFVQSNALEQIAYDETTHTLCATFRDSGRRWVYRDVPQEIYDALLFADSLGTFFNAYIRGRYPEQEV